MLAVPWIAAAQLACGSPLQSGEIVVLPGATERLLVAMRMGYAGAGDAVAGARVERAVLDEQLPTGPAAAGRLGDWVLENDRVIAVVTRVDGSARGGRLVDLTATDASGEALAGLELVIDGAPVRYVLGKSGSDVTTGAAYVEVSGHVVGRPDLRVSTRYDVAPGLPAVVIHSQVAGLGREVWLGAVLDRARFVGAGELVLGATDAPTPTSELAPGHAAWIDGRRGYLLRPLSDTPLLVARALGAPGEAHVGLGGTASEDPLLYSRVLAPLSDPTPASIRHALARLEGREPLPLPIEPELD